MLIPTLYLWVLLDILSGVGLCVVLWGAFFFVFFRFLSVILCVFYLLACKGWILNSFGLVVASEVEELLGVCWFVVHICDDLAIYLFYKDV